MQFRPSAPLALLFALAGLVGCSGGGATVESLAVACSGSGGKALCLTNCSLGCGDTGCLRTDIAQNELIVFQFSSDVDPGSVNTDTIQLRTGSGAMPVGEFFVNGNQVEFVPTLLVSGGQSFFGFSPGETYTLTLPGGDSPVSLKDTSGRKFKETLTCTLVANQGIVDLNGVPPTAALVVPSASQLQSAPRSTLIVLEFNEMIDATPFLLASGSTGPISVTVRRSSLVGGSRICDLNSLAVAVGGSGTLSFDPARGRSVWTFRPNTDLPGNACIEVGVTSAVVDLSGKPATAQIYRFLTETVPLTETSITEEFVDDSRLDRDVSAGTWTAGIAQFGQIGGDGRHGKFDPTVFTNLGLINGKQTYQINTDLTVIPDTRTRTGLPISVTDGKFFFEQMVVPSNVRLRFIGSKPPVFTVSGKLDIQGEIDLAGQTLTTFPVSTTATGQLGGTAGVGGGAGGQGGDKCLGTGYLANFDGRHGSNGGLLGGRAYATSGALSGGRGSTLFPASGLLNDIFFGVTTGLAYSPSAAAGGGGGGNLTAGAIGRVVSNNHIDPVLLVAPRLDVMGPSANGGTAVQYFPFPPATGLQRSSEHFLVGGGGGGGAGGSPGLTILLAKGFAPGAGGGGGGGAIGIRAGDTLNVSATGRLFANGGSAASMSGVSTSASAPPGGGGAGGSIVVQSGRQLDLSGLLDVRGGNGGTFNRTSSTPTTPPTGVVLQIQGGNGSPGFVRCEIPGGAPLSALANMQPAATTDNVGNLVELDDLVMFQSSWYSTGLAIGPEYARYEIHATLTQGSSSQTVIFSDDPAVSTVPAPSAGMLRPFFQAANLDLGTGLPVPLPGQTEPLIQPWRSAVLSTQTVTGIASDGLNGFRFALVLDRVVAAGATITIDKVKVVYRV